MNRNPTLNSLVVALFFTNFVSFSAHCQDRPLTDSSDKTVTKSSRNSSVTRIQIKKSKHPKKSNPYAEKDLESGGNGLGGFPPDCHCVPTRQHPCAC